MTPGAPEIASTEPAEQRPVEASRDAVADAERRGEANGCGRLRVYRLCEADRA